VVARVDHENKVVHVRRSKDDIKNAPEYEESTYASETYRTELGGYYDRFGVPLKARGSKDIRRGPTGVRVGLRPAPRPRNW